MKKRSTQVVATFAVMAALIVVANLLDKAYSFGLTALIGAALAVCALVSVTLSATVYDKWYYAVGAGVIFGLVSFALAYIFPSPLFQNPLISVLPRAFIGIIGYGAYKLAQLAVKAFAAFAGKTHMHFAVPLALVGATVAGLVCFIIFARGLNSIVYFVLIWLIVLVAIFFTALTFACVSAAKGGDDERGREHIALCTGAFFTVVSNTALVLPMMFLFGGRFGSLSEVYATLTLINFLPELLITVAVAPFVILGVRRGLRLGVDGKPRYKKQTEDEDKTCSEPESGGADTINEIKEDQDR